MALNKKLQGIRRYTTMLLNAIQSLSFACSTMSKVSTLQHDLWCKVQSF